MNTYLDGRAVELNLQQLKIHDYTIIYDRLERNIYLVDVSGNISFLGGGEANFTLSEALNDSYLFKWVYTNYDSFKSKLAEVIKSSF